MKLKEEIIKGIILLIVLLILNFFINREFHADVKGVWTRTWRGVYNFLKERDVTSTELSREIKELATYRSNWRIEKIEAVKTDKGLEYRIRAINVVSGDNVAHATPTLITIPKDLRYTIILGDPDRERAIPVTPDEPFIYKIE